MNTKSTGGKRSAEHVVKDIRRATRRHFSSEDKIRIVLDGLRGEDSIAELCRKAGIAANRWTVRAYRPIEACIFIRPSGPYRAASEQECRRAVRPKQETCRMGSETYIGKKSLAAGGWGALKSCGKHVLQSRQPLTNAKTMLKANQADGFDCPGCAWGDPEHGSSFEFCENGIKAVSWEATKLRVTPDFFAKHSVTELRGWTDYDLEHQGRLTHPLRYNPETDLPAHTGKRRGRRPLSRGGRRGYRLSRDRATAIGHGLGLPARSMAADEAARHFGWFSHFATMDVRATNARTRMELGWDPSQPGLLDDLNRGSYLRP